MAIPGLAALARDDDALSGERSRVSLRSPGMAAPCPEDDPGSPLRDVRDDVSSPGQAHGSVAGIRRKMV
jgi:hypothetical protein